MKKVAWIVVTVVVLYSGLVVFFSNMADQAFKAMMSESQSSISAQGFIGKISEASFNKGLIKSIARTKMEINVAGPNKQYPFHLVLKHIIYHGPLMITPDGIKLGISYIITSLDQNSLTAKNKQIIDYFFNNKTPFYFTTHVKAGGELVQTVMISPFSYQTSSYAKRFGEQIKTNIERLTFSGVSGLFFTNPLNETAHVTGNFNLGKLELDKKAETKDIAITINPSTIAINVNKAYKSVMLDGNVELKIPQLLLSLPQQNSGILIKGAKMKYSAHETKSFSSGWQLNINQLLINGSEYAVLPPSSLRFSIDIDGIDKKAIRDLVDNAKTNRNIKRDHVELRGNSVEVADQNYSWLNKIIKNGTVLKNEIVLSSDTGVASTSFAVAYTGDKQLCQLNTVAELIGVIRGQLSILVDKTMLNYIPDAKKLASMGRVMGLIIENKAVIGTSVLLDAGKLDVNGKPLSFAESLNKPLPWNSCNQ